MRRRPRTPGRGACARCSAATTPNPSRPSTSYGIWRMTPLASAGMTALPARAPISSSRSSPPSTLVRPLLVGLGGGEDDPVPRARHRVDQPDVVALGARRLGELDVVGDDPRPGVDQPIDHAGVQAARKRIRGEGIVAERAVVDPDDHDVLGRRLRAPDVEAHVDGQQLESARRVGGVERRSGRHAEAARQQHEQRRRRRLRRRLDRRGT